LGPERLFGWRGKQAITATQVGFAILVLAYFGSKFVLERLLA
jgi:Cytochrome C assembly protein.